MSSLLTCGRPICRPFALAFSIPDRTRERIIASSNWLNTPAMDTLASPWRRFLRTSFCPKWHRVCQTSPSPPIAITFTVFPTSLFLEFGAIDSIFLMWQKCRCSFRFVGRYPSSYRRPSKTNLVSCSLNLSFCPKDKNANRVLLYPPTL